MNTFSLCLLRLRRLAGIALFSFLVAIPGAFAQIIVVSDNSPVDPSLPQRAEDFCGGGNGDLEFCYRAQAFSLTSGSWVNQITLTFRVITAEPAGTFPLKVVITSKLGDLSTSALDLDVLVPVPESRGSATFPGEPYFPFSVGFPAIFLPKGSYYLVLHNPEPTPFGGGTWAMNQVGSSEVGVLGQSFCSTAIHNNFTYPCPFFPNWQVVIPNEQLTGWNGTYAFELDGPLTMPTTGGGFGQIARLVVEGPVRPSPGGPVEAKLGFLDMSGKPIGRSSTVTLGPGKTQSLDLNLSQFANGLGQRIEVQPFVAQVQNAAGAPSATAQLSATIQILDAKSGFETVLIPVPGSSAPALGPQVLAAGQTMRISATASSFAPCHARLSFVDSNGTALGLSLPVKLSPGMGTSLDLNANSLGLTLGRGIEVQPMVTPIAAPSASGALINSVCQVTVDVFDHLTGRTWTSQSTLTAPPTLR